MKQIAIKEPTIAELKIQLQEAQIDADSLFKESKSAIVSLIAEASKVKKQGINSNEELKTSGNIVSRINKISSEFHEKRKAVTKIFDYVKNTWISKERDALKTVCEYRDHLMQVNGEYTVTQAKILKDKKDKINKEKNYKIELDSMPIAIEYKYKLALTTEISNIKTNFAKSWANLTPDNFEEKIKILKSYTPKIEYTKLQKYLVFTPSFITNQEVATQIKKYFNFKKFCEEYSIQVRDIRKIYINQIELKREEFKTATPEQLIQNKTKIEEEEFNRRVQENIEQLREEAKLTNATSQIILGAEMLAQSRIQALPGISGRKKIIVELTGKKIDWQSIVELYVKEYGVSDVMFLLDNLAKDQPIIQGIKYQESIININRA